MSSPPLKVFLSPVGLYSRAMMRIANALTRHKPEQVSIVQSPAQSDLQILYVIGTDAIDYCSSLNGKQYAIVQCCITPGMGYSSWLSTWRDSVLVWSYYDLDRLDRLDRGIGNLNSHRDFNFYHAPLGLDDCFVNCRLHSDQRRSIITTGYVSGPGAEAIEPVWLAAEKLSIPVIHIGPNKIKGIDRKPSNVATLEGVSDQQLVYHLSAARYVFSLRYVEGFELPAAEGLACGARPVLFPQDCTRHWYRDNAIYLPELVGENLVSAISNLLEESNHSYSPVTQQEKDSFTRRFSWKAICEGFWTSLLRGINA